VRVLDERIDAQEKGKIDLAQILGERSGGVLVRGTRRTPADVWIREVYDTARGLQSEIQSSSSDEIVRRQEKNKKARQEGRERERE
jgi:hypothetical protein